MLKLSGTVVGRPQGWQHGWQWAEASKGVATGIWGRTVEVVEVSKRRGEFPSSVSLHVFCGIVAFAITIGARRAGVTSECLPDNVGVI
jgi:hypothetical protein